MNCSRSVASLRGFGFFLIIWLSCSVQAQIIEPAVVSALPSVLPEASGMETGLNNTLWLINDSGNPSEIIAIDQQGNVQRQLVLANAPNIDFEDLCRDESGNLYVGDFGNNLSDRQNLVIYKITDPDAVTGDTALPVEIRFSYPDQQQFPSIAQRSFDCEAMFHFQGHLYLVSKNPSSTLTQIYRLPDTAGTHVATLLDSASLGARVTAADISPDQTTIAFLSESRLILFRGFSGDQFFSGQRSQIAFSKTKKEALVFETDSILFLADEREDNPNDGFLYRLDVFPIVNHVASAQYKPSEIRVIPNPVRHGANILLSGFPVADYQLQVFNTSGVLVQQTAIRQADEVRVDSQHLGAGLYFFQVISRHGKAWSGHLVVVP